jgi:hypothetical protein
MRTFRTLAQLRLHERDASAVRVNVMQAVSGVLTVGHGIMRATRHGHLEPNLVRLRLDA